VEDIVFTFNSAGQIESLAFGLDDIATQDILSKQAWPENARMAIIEFLENYKTAFALERLEYIRTIFDDNAVIIVGKLATVASSVVPEYQTQYNNKVVIRTRYTKEQYLKNLERCYASALPIMAKLIPHVTDDKKGFAARVVKYGETYLDIFPNGKAKTAVQNAINQAKTEL
jgi:hypothetical protein